LGERTRAVAFTHCSNVVASINPVRELCDRIRAAGAIAIVDGVSFAPHGLPDIPELGADVYFFSLYKVYGPHLGVMVLRRELNRDLPYQGHFFNEEKPGYRFTPAGPDHAQIAAANGVIDYLEAVYAHHSDAPATPVEQARVLRRLFRARETELLQPLLDFLSGRERTRLIGKSQAEDRAPTVAFSSDKRSSQEIAAELAKMNIGVGAGDFYAYRLVQALGYDMNDGVVRASFVHYTAPEEIQRLIEALDTLL
jgi:selenocysteine lyase/cysteine desulfurase